MYNYKEANEILTNKFPEMKKIYESDIEEYKNLFYYFYETEFVKYIIDKIIKNDEQELMKIFDFIEDMFANGDDEIVNLVGVAIVESLFFEKNFNELYITIKKYCGERTLKSFENCFQD